MINQILGAVVNIYYDIKDAQEAKEVQDIKSNIIELACVVSDDLPTDLVNQYCKALEVVYAANIRAIIASTMRNRGNSNVKSIFKSIPLLTNSDTLKFDREYKTLVSASEKIFKDSEKIGGHTAVGAFLEQAKVGIENLNSTFGMGTEDLFMTEQRGGMPTFVECIVNVSVVGGKDIEKTIPIGVSIKPKVFPAEDILSFFIKQNKKIVNVTPVEKSRKKMLSLKSALTSTRIKNEKNITFTPNEKKTLNDALESVKNIDKPFICMLISSSIKDMLKDSGLDITKPQMLKHIYSKLPIISMSVYDMNLDMISYSLLKDTSMTNTTTSSFVTDVSQLQKTLTEGLRVSKMLS